MSRPRKYATDAERKAARSIQNMASRARSRAKARTATGRQPGPVNPDCEPPVRVPPEVLAEADYRCELMAGLSADTPPPTYAGAYYVKAWRMQQHFAGST